ncbi:hypothetical protein CASFOL_025364 [Castilleja foliolosa]|uniref:Superoxide dismutase copper/zinc binding domain-containing protein n=1 Tax=Castilleja foliolosa TaxID=1961234 RepID=A0ABD3CUN5_9LAMI
MAAKVAGRATMAKTPFRRPHFNPLKKDHGSPLEDERHAGDLGNIMAGSNGVADISIADRQITLSGQHSILGRAVVVHADPDDLGKGGHELSKATGNAGARVGCVASTNNVSAHYVQEENLKDISKENEHMGKLLKEEKLIESPERVGSPAKADEQMRKLPKEEISKELLDEAHEKGETVDSRSKVNDHNDFDHKKAELVESTKYLHSPTKVDEQMGKLPKEESFKESPFQKNEDLGSPKKVDVETEKLLKEEVDSIKEDQSVKSSTARNEVSTKSTNGE